MLQLLNTQQYKVRIGVVAIEKPSGHSYYKISKYLEIEIA